MTIYPEASSFEIGVNYEFVIPGSACGQGTFQIYYYQSDSNMVDFVFYNYIKCPCRGDADGYSIGWEESVIINNNSLI